MAYEKPPLLILLGAGATVPDIPGVASLTEELVAWRKYLSPTSDGSILPKGGVEDDTRVPFFRYLHDRLPHPEKKSTLEQLTLFEIHDQLPEPTFRYNFEQLIGCCESLANAFVDDTAPPTTWDGSLQILSPYSRFLTPCGTLDSRSELHSAHEDARYFILDRVSRACESASERMPLAKGLAELANTFTLKVASLNYDDTPLRTGIPFQDGYKRYPYGFVPISLYSEPLRHMLLHLHGSVLFGTDHHRKATVPKYKSLDEARDNWKLGAAGFGPGADGFHRHSLPMITGFRKAEAAIWEPYGTYHSVFRYLTSTIRNWLIVGYGGSDSHVNAALQSAVIDTVSNPWYRATPIRAVVVDYCECEPNHPLDLYADDPVNRIIISRLFTKWARVDLLSPESRKYLRDGMIHPQSVNRIAERTWMTLDGSAWAFTEGLSDIANVFLDGTNRT